MKVNWRRLYAVTQIIGVVGGISIGGAGFYSVIIIGLCRKVIGLGDSISVFAIGLPFFIILLLIFIKHLPKPLRKAGMLSDEPEKFGPWFKQDPKP
ncbi:hypothetical protein [Paraburkholderia hayleyella]|uniref:hypothetical protein n=1 Tax=Paraburkholderia hayleyella TaxID=2152889 RepID=UPI0012926351|nr:hypothetical protein [Paraburkholderia hayleyella]